MRPSSCMSTMVKRDLWLVYYSQRRRPFCKEFLRQSTPNIDCQCGSTTGDPFLFLEEQSRAEKVFLLSFFVKKDKQIKNKRQHKIHPKMGKPKNKTNRHPTVFWYRVLCFCCSVVLSRLLSSHCILFVSFSMFFQTLTGVWISPSLLWRYKIDYMHTMWRTVLFFRHIRILTAIPCSLMSVEEKNHYEFECRTRLLPLP